MYWKIKLGNSIGIAKAVAWCYKLLRKVISDAKKINIIIGTVGAKNEYEKEI